MRKHRRIWPLAGIPRRPWTLQGIRARPGPWPCPNVVQRTSAPVLAAVTGAQPRLVLRAEPSGSRPRSPRPVSPQDYTRDFLLKLHRQMVLIREFEEGVKFLFLEGAMPGTIHQCQGQEATAVGVCAALERE